METISFALGVASVLIVLLSTVTIWNMLKVKKLTKEKENLHILINNVEQNLNNKIDDVQRHIHETFREVHNLTDRISTDIYRSIEISSDDSKKYTDSRIDKLIDAYFSHYKEIGSKSKQIIKG
jgi:CHASE1-domain containing sensor protein